MFSKRNRRVFVTILCLALMFCFGGSAGLEKTFAEEEEGLTRAEWLSELVSTFEMEVEEDNMPDDYFADVTPDDDYYEDVMKAAEFGVIDIEAGGNVEPEAALTREFAAHTLAFCLGYEDDGETEYTFSDTDAVEDDYAAQIAVDRGWFALISGAFKPDQNVTEDEKDAMLGDAAELISHTEIDTSHKNTFTFDDGVVVIPENTEVSISDDATQVTINGTQYASQLTQGALFAVYQNGIPVGYKVVSAEAQNGNTVVTVTSAEDEEILTDADAEGIIEGDLAEFVPAEGVEIVKIETEDEDEDLRGTKKAKGTKKIKNIILAKTISLGNGLEVTPSFTVTDIKMKYKTRWLSYVYAGVEADVTMSGTISVDVLESLGVDKSISLGYVNIAGVGYVSLKGVIGLDGSFTASSTYHLNAGIEKASFTAPVRIIKTFKKKQYSLHTKINAKLGVRIEAGFNVVEMLKGFVYGEAGAKAELNVHEYLDGKLPNRCSTLTGWMYAEYGYNMSAFMGKWKLGSDHFTVYDFSNSPVRLLYHWEDGRLVSKCTRNANEMKYFTKYNSRYGGAYDGYGLDEDGQLVPVFTFEVFENEKAQEEARITGYTGNAGALVIPETVSDEDGTYPVTQIGESAFANRSDIIFLQIPSSVTLIDEYAFAYCSNLISVSMADSVTEIRGGAFAADKSLYDVTLSKGLKTVGGQAFADCDALRSIEIPKSIKETTSFYIPHIVIPVSGADFTTGVFLGCDNLNHVTFEEGITEIPVGLFTHTTGLQQLVIPDTVTTIGSGAFRGCKNLESVDWSDALVTIKDRAFFECTSLKSCVLPDTITEIQAFAFAKNTAITNLKLPKNLKKAGGGAFCFCNGLTSVEIPKALTSTTAEYEPAYYKQYVTDIGGDYFKHGLFFRCENLSDVTFEEGITTIPEGVLAYTYGLKHLTIPDTVTKIGDYAFSGCRYLEDIQFSNKLTSVGSFAFNECVTLNPLEFPETVSEIKSFAFAGDLSLEDLTLPPALNRIGGGAFAKCDGLTTVTIPKTLKTAYSEYSPEYQDPYRNGTSGIFMRSQGPKKVIFEEGTTAILPGVLEYSYGLEEVVIPDGVTSVGEYAFRDCSALKTVTLPGSVESIDNHVFAGCAALTKATLPANITRIPAYAFGDCASLESITIPENVNRIYDGAFDGSGLKKIEIPAAVTMINDAAFMNCKSLTEVTFKGSPEYIGESAFENDTVLKTIELPDGLETLEKYAFYECDALEEISVPGSVTDMGTGIFQYCDALKTVSFGSGITDLPSQILANDPALTTVKLPITLTTIGSKAFSDDTALNEITIHRNVSSIASDAFSYYSSLTIYGVAGTYAETFANENGARFVAIDHPATSIQVGQTEVTMNSGEKIKISVTVAPEDCTDAITWKSANADVVSVSSDGTLTAEGPGSTTVKVTAGSVSASIKVTVKQGVTRIYLSDYELEMMAGETYELEAEVWPESADNKDIIWSSSDESVAVVSENGIVTALSKGEAVIKATSAANPNIYEECEVTVTGSVHVVTNLDDLQSAHPYGNDINETWQYKVEGASALDVTFSSETEMEDGFDYLYLINTNGTEQGKYTGTALAGKTVTVNGDTVTIRLVSDDSGNAWGFRVTDVRAASGPVTCDHEYGEWVDDENDKTHSRICSKCGEKQTKNHDLKFVETTYQPTMTEGGEDLMECETCGAEVYVETEPATTGQCGAKVNYSYDPKTGVLTISGTGAIYDYDDWESPFADTDKVTKIVIKEGVTVIGTNAFPYMTDVDSISLPTSLKSIKEGAFTHNTVAVIHYAGTAEEYAQINMADDVKRDFDGVKIENESGSGDDPGDDPTPVQKKSIAKQGLKLSRNVYVYTGKPIKPAVTAKGLTRNTDYSLSYKNNKAVGVGKVIVTGLGKYTGTWTGKFTIIPKKATISKLKPGAKKLTVKMGTKVAATGGSKYQISYRIKGKSKWKTITTSSQTVVLKKLKKGKKYQVRVRAFKVVSGIKYYGYWSKVATSKKIK